MSPRIGSLFSGYGGLEMGVQAVIGGEVVWHSEIDEAANKTLAHRYPGVPNLGDITTIDWESAPPVDVMTAGWPCQPFSLAGKRKGAADERALWPYVSRAIRMARPPLVVLENVAAVLTAGEFQRLADSLAALRYDFRWVCLRASAVGAPHGRQRVFIVAHAQGGQVGAAGLARSGPGDLHSDTAALGRRAQGWHDGIRTPGLVAVTPADPHQSGPQGSESTPGRVVPSRVVVSNTAGDGRDQGRPEPARLGRRHDATECGATTPDSNGHPVREQPVTVGRSSGSAIDGFASSTDWGSYEPAIRRWEHAVGRDAPSPTEPGSRGGRRLSPGFVEWMMGLPAGWVTDVPDVTRNQQLRALGNGVVPQQASAALSWLLSLDQAVAS